MCSHNHINNCVPSIAGQLIGAITTNYDFNFSHEGLSRLLQLTQPKILFVSSEAALDIRKALKEAQFKTILVVFESDGAQTDFSEFLKSNVNENTFVPYHVTNNKETAMILFSSGTTGMPKGICLHHFGCLSVLNNGNLFSMSHVKGQDPVYLLYTNLYWMGAVMALVASMYYGAARILCLAYNTNQNWDMIEKYQVSFLI